MSTSTDTIKPGDSIYVPTAWYISHGQDDFTGGLCTVSRIEMGISAGEKVAFVEVSERPGHLYNWPILAKEQESLRAEFGDRRGHRDPDYSPECNDGGLS